MRKSFVFLLFYFSLFLVAFSQKAERVVVESDKILAPVSKDFWGSNFLYWIEDDASLADGKLAQLLKENNCPVLRYPGGTVADNFHWKTATLDNPFMFPYESGEAESDFEEFMAFCRKVGAEPMLVVNTQSWFLDGKVEEGARYAADWVQYCKDKGYQVRYWEIGNETYWHHVMTAREYGDVVAKYAKAMRKVNPDIIISANGHWDINMVGTKERTDKQFLATFNEKMEKADQEGKAKLMKEGKQMLAEKKITKGEDKWWDNVLDECGEHIDMISIHWYYHENRLFDIEPKLNELKAFVTEKMNGKQYKWAMTEYNCNSDDDAQRLAGFAEGIGKFLNFGFDVATHWPMRIGGMEHRSMFSLKEIKPQYPYQIFKLFGNELRGNMVKCISTEDVFAFASVSESQISIVLSGTGVESKKMVAVEVPGVKLSSKKIHAINCAAEITGKRTVTLGEKQIAVEISENCLQVPVEPDSFVFITLKTR
jgi:hypothetical protein